MVENRWKIYVNNTRKRLLPRNTSLVNLYNDIRHIEPLTQEETNELIDIYRNGNKEESEAALEKLCKHNLKLVVSVAKKYCTTDDNLTDLIQEGSIGLMKAIDNFDMNVGTPLYAYAIYWIRREINMFKINVSPMIIQTNRSKTSITITEIRNSLIQKLERTPTSEEILEEYNNRFPDKKLNKKDDFVDVEYVYLSELDTSINDNTNSKRNESDYNQKSVSYNDYMEDIELDSNKEIISSLITCLKPKERMIIERLYGLNGQTESSSTSLAFELNMTVAGINNIKQRAIEKMQKHSAKLKPSFK